MATLRETKEQINAALGLEKADVVVKNAMVLNVFTEQFEKKDIAIKNGTIVGLDTYEGMTQIDAEGKTVVPGFIDGHVHLESSVVSPKQFCRAVVPHGTTTVVADPHEITNVLGKTGFQYMLEAAKGLPLDIRFMVPSCVPATPFDEAGAVITAQEVEELMTQPGVLGLAEMMNFPGVLGGDTEVLKKIDSAQNNQKIVDGHAPTLSGKALNAYITSGVRSDHECTTAEEAIEKIRLGQWLMVREGTASKNLEALLPLFEKPYCDRCMLVTDDKHPGELATEGHIDYDIRKAISLGANPINAYKMASFNAARYFGLTNVGAVAPGYAADFVILDDVNTVKIHAVYKNGKRVDDSIDSLLSAVAEENPYATAVKDTVHIQKITADSFRLKKEREKVIGLVPGEILTTDEGYASAVDTDRDICKLSVIERHHNTGHVGVAFVKGYGLKAGAVATSIAHDSHNIIVVGTNDEDMAYAVSKIKELQGGMVVVRDGQTVAELALPIAGLMCELEANECEYRLAQVKQAAYALGVHTDIDPFMTLSFSSLAVIPTLRLTTLGVVDVTRFELLH